MSDKERYRCAGVKSGGRCSLPVATVHKYCRVCVTCALGWQLRAYGRMTVGQHVEILSLEAKKAIVTMYQELANNNIPKDLRNKLVQMYLDTGIVQPPQLVPLVKKVEPTKFCNYRTKVDGQMVMECFKVVNGTGFDLCDEHRH